MEINGVCKNQLYAPSPSQCAEHYGCIYENNHLVTLLVDPRDGAIADANRAASEFYGYTVRELKKLHISDLNAMESRLSGSFVQKALQEGEEGTNRFFLEKHKRANGQIIDVEIHTGLISMLGKQCIYSVIHDVGERLTAEQRLKESEERYRDLVELCPEAILVSRHAKILFANRQTELLFRKSKEELIGSGLEVFIDQNADGYEMQLQESSKSAFRKEQRIVSWDGRTMDIEISGAPITYEGTDAVQLVLRDITESKRDIERAIRLQEHRQRIEFPLPDKVSSEILYVSATSLSGDFYFYHKLNEDQVVGIIGDVAGKGIAAALSISAMRVLFQESVAVYGEPVQILHDLNRKILQHMEEEYTAACCFLLDFRQGVLRAAAAGINEFNYVPKGQDGIRQVIKGAPLGMFETSMFDQTSIEFQAGDRFCFYSDGMEFILNDSLAYDYQDLKDRIAHTALQDDCTWLCLKIKER
ncbi:MAG: putative sensor protein [Paenibacillaceae bacterium]|jgi:PAS domain S-box-containing protein|nr:putative sensor protein [Paenibacillaceae bacterium]